MKRNTLYNIINIVLIILLGFSGIYSISAQERIKKPLPRNNEIKIVENKKIRDSNNKEREEIIAKSKVQFETKKQEILAKVKSGEITRQDARKQILEQREVIIKQSKEDLKKLNNKIKKPNLDALKEAVSNYLDSKLTKFDALSKDKKKEMYEKILQKTEESTKIAPKQKQILYRIIKEVITEKIDSLK